MGVSDATVEQATADGSITTAVVSAVAEATGADPTEMEPLYTAVDPDALETLFLDVDVGVAPTGHIEFEYCNCEVVVTADRSVYVSDSDAGSSQGHA